MWSGDPEPFTCVVNAPEKKSKFKGMKSFIAYNITPSVSIFVKFYIINASIISHHLHGAGTKLRAYQLIYYTSGKQWVLYSGKHRYQYPNTHQCGLPDG